MDIHERFQPNRGVLPWPAPYTVTMVLLQLASAGRQVLTVVFWQYHTTRGGEAERVALRHSIPCKYSE